MLIEVCVGNSCRNNGSEEIIDLFGEEISKYSEEYNITLAGSFCTANCAAGVTVIINGETVRGVTKENFREIFKEKVLNPLEAQPK